MPSTKSSAGHRRPRHSAEHWQTIIRRFEAGDLGPVEFCCRENLAITSFDRWRRRLLAEEARPGFVELQHPIAPTSAPLGGGWALEIDLPGGVSMRIHGGR